jgi:hypothetical protein
VEKGTQNDEDWIFKVEPRSTHSFAAPPTVALVVLRRTLALAVTARLTRV